MYTFDEKNEYLSKLSKKSKIMLRGVWTILKLRCHMITIMTLSFINIIIYH